MAGLTLVSGVTFLVRFFRTVLGGVARRDCFDDGVPLLLGAVATTISESTVFSDSVDFRLLNKAQSESKSI